MKRSFKRLSLFSMFALSSVFAYVSYTLNKTTGSQGVIGDLFGADIAEGASCVTVISCTNGSGSGTGSGTSSGSGSGSGSGSSSCSAGD